MEEFPLFKLPLIPFFDVLKQNQVQNLIKFSFASKRCQRIATLLKPKFKGICVHLDKSQILFRLEEAEGFHDVWKVQRGNFDKSQFSTVTIGEKDVQIHTSSYIHTMTTEDPFLIAKEILQYLKDLLKLEVKFIYFLTDNFGKLEEMLKIGVKKCEDLTFEGTIPLENDQLVKIIKSIEATNVIYLNAPTNSDFSIDSIHFYAKQLNSIESSEWFTSAMLFDVTCPQLMLLDCACDSNDVLQFIEKWLSSEDTKFEWMYLATSDKKPSFEVEITGQLQWDKNKRGPHYKLPGTAAMDCSKGWDVERSDGVLATLLIRDDVLFFGVWGERFPFVTNPTFL